MYPENNQTPGKRPANKLFLLIFLAVLAAGLWYGLSRLEKPAISIRLPRVNQELPPGFYRVTKVMDGDTVEVDLEGKTETVRFIGIDTPETHDPRKPVQCFGREAGRHLQELINGQPVRLQADPQDNDRDKYQRLLRYVYLPDGSLLNSAMIRDGYAFAYTIFPHEKLDEFRGLEREARAAGRGLWSACPVNEDSAVKQTAPA